MDGVLIACACTPSKSIGGEMAETSVNDAVRRLARGRDEVGGAILLVSRGAYGVVIANLPDARALASEFGAEAARQGVELILEERGGDRADLRVRRR